jgi:DNA invertase Pin-like site-specific DNA recombinase
VDNQRLALEAVCEQRGWQLVQTYSDSGVSGAKGRSQRPGLDMLLKDASRGRFDVVLAWALDRLGRSLVDLLDTLNELEAAGAALVLHQQAIDTTTPGGRMFFQVTGAFAEFERALSAKSGRLVKLRPAPGHDQMRPFSTSRTNVRCWPTASFSNC